MKKNIAVKLALSYRYIARRTRELMAIVHDTESKASIFIAIAFIFSFVGDLLSLSGFLYPATEISQSAIDNAMHVVQHVLHWSHAITAIYAFVFILNVIFGWLGDPLCWSKSLKNEKGWVDIMDLAVSSTHSSVRTVTDEDLLNRIVNMGDEAFGSTYVSKNERKVIFSIWHEANSGTFRLLTEPSDSNADIGYVCVLPLTERAAEKYLHGKKMSLFSFDKEDILTANDPTARTVFIEAVYLRPTRQDDTFYFVPLIHAMFLCIAAFTNQRNVNEIRIIAETFTPDGVKIVRKFGLSKLKKSILGFDIYSLDFREKDHSPQAIATMNAIRSMQRAANENRKHTGAIEPAAPI